MNNFNYQKAYCVQAVPAFELLPHHVKNVHSKIRALVGELSQDRDLNIPLTTAIQGFLDDLTTPELADLSRASYFVGHWHPGLLPQLHDNLRGESWKVANCCDQVLRRRLAPMPRNIQIHEGVLRVTFSSSECWLWEEFALATGENLETFKNCGLRFGENTLQESAGQLKNKIGDLWPDVDTVPDNDLYRRFLKLNSEKEKQGIIDRFRNKNKKLEQDKLNAQIEIDFLLLCNSVGIPTDNVIYYAHTKTFCFGWMKPLNEKERQLIVSKLESVEHGQTINFK